jgi:hypothetical protein
MLETRMVSTRVSVVDKAQLRDVPHALQEREIHECEVKIVQAEMPMNWVSDVSLIFETHVLRRQNPSPLCLQFFKRFVER